MIESVREFAFQLLNAAGNAALAGFVLVMAVFFIAICTSGKDNN